MFAEKIYHDTKVEHDHNCHQALCPSCGNYTTFTLLGVQRYPEYVAAKLGLPTEINLWTCGVCKSTISEVDLMF
jgi:hypothetical protein